MSIKTLVEEFKSTIRNVSPEALAKVYIGHAVDMGISPATVQSACLVAFYATRRMRMAECEAHAGKACIACMSTPDGYLPANREAGDELARELWGLGPEKTEDKRNGFTDMQRARITAAIADLENYPDADARDARMRIARELRVMLRGA